MDVSKMDSTFHLFIMTFVHEDKSRLDNSDLSQNETYLSIFIYK